jgi:peroxiredoxin
MPLLVNAQKQYGSRGLQVIGPALDDAKSVRELAAELKLNYPTMADYNSADAAMMLLGNAQGGLPFSVFIDAKGRIVKTVLGEMTQRELDTLITANLPLTH